MPLKSLRQARIFTLDWRDAGLMAIAVALSQRWFAIGRFIAAGDVTPFHRESLISEFGWLWNHQQTGAGSTTYDAVRAIEVAAVEITKTFGGGALLAQRVLYGVIAAITVLGGSMFSRRFGAGAWTSRLLGLLALVNPFVMVQLPNPLPMMAIGVMGILGALVIDAGLGQPKRLEFVVASLLVSYIALNPALLAVTAIWVVAVAAIATPTQGPGSTGRALRFLARTALPVAVVNLWWIVPVVLVVFKPIGSSVAAVRNVSDWAWSHADNSLENVITLKAVWGWDTPQYYPYAASLDATPIRFLRYAFPLLAFSAAFISKGPRRRGALVLLGFAVALVFGAKGLHEPFASVNLFLYDNVPGFWLLREPMGKLGAPLVLVYVGLVATLLAAAGERLGPLGHPSSEVRPKLWSDC